VIKEEYVQNLGFFECVYAIDGQLIDGTQYSVLINRTEESKFHTFKDEKPGKTAKWRYLEVTCKPLQ